MRDLVNSSPAAPVDRLQRSLCQDLSPVDRAGADAADGTVAGAIFDPLRTSVGGIAGFDLLFPWLVGLWIGDGVLEASSLSKNESGC
jgi:hypothetical protein